MKIQLRRNTAAQWAALNPVLFIGEPGLDTTSGIIKYGDGVTAWNSLTGAPATSAGISAQVDALFSVPALPGLQLNVTAGAPSPTYQNGPGKRTYLQGQLALGAVTFVNGTSLFTVPAGSLPEAGAVLFPCRTVGSNTVFQIRIDATGLATNVGAIVSAGDTVNIDGMNYRHA